MKTIEFHLTCEQNEQMKMIKGISGWKYFPAGGTLELTIKEHPHCPTCGQQLQHMGSSDGC